MTARPRHLDASERPGQCAYMKPNRLRPRGFFTLSLDAWALLRERSETTGVPMSRLVEDALRAHLTPTATTEQAAA